MKNQLNKKIILGAVVLMMSGMFSGVNSIQAACEIEAKVGFVWITVYKCDSTPNETCSAEGTDDEGVAYSFSCDGKETINRFGDGDGGGNPGVD